MTGPMPGRCIGRRLRASSRAALITRYLRLDQYGFAVLIDAMDGKDVLGKIDSNCDNALGFPLSGFVKWMA